MIKYIAQRLLMSAVTIVGVFVAVFFVIRLIPGDPALSMLGADATDAQIAVYREKFGLNEPLPVQFGLALKGFVSGDLGDSISLREPVARAVASRLPYTAELSLLGIAIGLSIAVALGIAAATRRGKWLDVALISLSTLGMSMPTFFVGIWVLMIFARGLGVIPVIGNVAGVPHWKSLLGPLLTMVLGETSMMMRTTRSAMLEIFDEDFIRTARAKGLGERAILYRHALGNALIPIVTIAGYNLATAFGGAIVLESVFTRNGIGKLLIDAINARDYPLVQGTTIVIASLMILVNIMTDVAYGFVDPRIRVAGDAG
ncbi:MAG: ABC transporter permease [Clostridiales bacterium]|jgi:ABC-type dipeptide/oligopeptide/nickel transport system permease component|nr:ABC transporter permease [Clostridiales bacterium]